MDRLESGFGVEFSGDRERSELGRMDDMTSTSYGSRRSRPAAAAAAATVVHGETRIIPTQITDTPSSYREETAAAASRNYRGEGGGGMRRVAAHGLTASGSGAAAAAAAHYEPDYQSFDGRQMASADRFGGGGENRVAFPMQQQTEWRFEPKRRSYRSRSLDNQRDFIIDDYLLTSERARMKTPAVDYPLDSASIRHWSDARLAGGGSGRRHLDAEFWDDQRYRSADTGRHAFLDDNMSAVKKRLTERRQERLGSYPYRDVSTRNYEYQPNTVDIESSWNAPLADVLHSDERALPPSSYRTSQLYTDDDEWSRSMARPTTTTTYRDQFGGTTELMGTANARTLPSLKRDYRSDGVGVAATTTSRLRHEKSPDKRISGTGAIASLLGARRHGKFTTVSGRSSGGAVAASGITSAAGTRSGLGALFPSSSTSAAAATTSSRSRGVLDSEFKPQSQSPFNIDTTHASYYPSVHAQQVLTSTDNQQQQQQQQQRFGTIKTKTTKKFHRFGGGGGGGAGTLKPKSRSKSNEFIYSPSSSTGLTHSATLAASGGSAKYDAFSGGGGGMMSTTESTGLEGGLAANRSTSLTYRPHSQYYQAQQPNHFSYGTAPPYETSADRSGTDLFHADERFVAPSILISGDQGSSYPQYRQHRSGLSSDAIKTLEPLSITTSTTSDPRQHRTMTFNVATDNKRYPPPPPAAPVSTFENVTSMGAAEQKFYKIHCCCMSFRWPPWRYEEVDAPQPIYRHQQ